MARDRFLTNATDDLPETETKRHAPTIQDLYLLPNQGAEAVASGARPLEREATFADKSYLY